MGYCRLESLATLAYQLRMISADVKMAIEELREGKVVAIPTETVYGLAAAIHHPGAVRKIFEIKGRPYFDPLIVHIWKIEQVFELAREFGPTARLLAEKFWPGPLTLILPKKKELSSIITANLDTVAVRMPAHPIARRVLQELGSPLAAPSANRFTKTSPTRAEHIIADYADISLDEKFTILDGGPSQVGLESTVVQVVETQDLVELRILRPGSITELDLEKFLQHLGKDFSIKVQSSVLSPGSLKEHYRPAVPLVLILKDEKKFSEIEKNEVLTRLLISGDIRISKIQLSGSPREEAQELYAQMRSASLDGSGVIFVFLPPAIEEAQSHAYAALRDRLERASSLIID